MSNFICEKCGTSILEGEDGYYINECEHYPLDEASVKHIIKSLNVIRQFCIHQNFRTCFLNTDKSDEDSCHCLLIMGSTYTPNDWPIDKINEYI